MAAAITLPKNWFPYIGSGNRIGQLRPSQSIAPYVSRKICLCHELTGWTSGSRRDQANTLSMVPSHKVQSLRYIAVVRNNYRAVKCIQPAVIQQMHGEVYIRTLFLCPEYFHLLSPPNRAHKRRPNFVCKETPVKHLNMGPKVLQTAEIYILPLGFRRIGGSGRNPGSEILDCPNVVMRTQHCPEQRVEIKPFPGSSL